MSDGVRRKWFPGNIFCLPGRSRELATCSVLLVAVGAPLLIGGWTHASQGGLRPQAPTALEVPPGMDPNNDGAV